MREREGNLLLPPTFWDRGPRLQVSKDGWALSQRNERTNGRTNERTNGRTKERTNGRTNERTNGRINERTNKQTNKQTDKQTKEQTDERTNEQMDEHGEHGITTSAEREDRLLIPSKSLLPFVCLEVSTLVFYAQSTSAVISG